MRILILLMAALVMAACKQNPELPSVISPFKIDIQQGNVVTQEMVGKLKAGLTRSQVRFVLGSPLVTDMFHGDRWDYIYLMQRQGKPDERRRLTVIFDGDKLLRLEGDVVITDKSLEPEPPAPKRPAAVVAPAPTPAAAKPVAATPVAKPEPAKSATSITPPAQSTKPDAAKTDTKTGTAAAAAKADAAKADAAKVEAAAADEKKDPPKRGMFGRMLDKIGF